VLTSCVIYCYSYLTYEALDDLHS